MQGKIYKRNIYRIFIHMSVYQKATFQKFLSDSRATRIFINKYNISEDHCGKLFMLPWKQLLTLGQDGFNIE